MSAKRFSFIFGVAGIANDSKRSLEVLWKGDLQPHRFQLFTMAALVEVPALARRELFGLVEPVVVS
jgi:hypothetical protein